MDIRGHRSDDGDARRLATLADWGAFGAAVSAIPGLLWAQVRFGLQSLSSHKHLDMVAARSFRAELSSGY
jgi:hypothetical protein